MSTRLRLHTAAAAAALLCLIATGCEFNTTDSRAYLYVRGWYRDQHIAVPFGVDGEARYAEYTYEYDDGSGWLTSVEKTIRVPRGGGGLIEFEAGDPAWQHRLTFSVLGRAAAGDPLEAVDTIVNPFGIDSTTPGIGPDELILNLYEGASGTPLPKPWPTYLNPSLSLELEVDHVEFDSPSGSRTRVYYTWDGSVPNENSESTDFRQRFRIWDGGGGGPYLYELKFIAIDEAGNRSGVRTVFLESF